MQVNKNYFTLPNPQLNKKFFETKQDVKYFNTAPLKNGAEILALYNKVSFKAQADPEIEQIKKYIKEERVNGRTFSSLDDFTDIEIQRLSNICKGIAVFEGINAKALQFITKTFDTILLQRGCSNQCSHCAVNADAKITTMDWDNYVDLVDGIAELKNRLGFNPFRIKSDDDDDIVPFYDSDPIFYKSKGHDIYDAAKLYYEKTGTKFGITTAGWDKNNKTANSAMDKIVKSPGCISSFEISVHPFHSIMQKSIEFRNNGYI